MIHSTLLQVTSLFIVMWTPSYVQEEADVTLQLISDRTGTHSMPFTEHEFHKFYRCLCKATTNSCIVDVHVGEMFFHIRPSVDNETNFQKRFYSCSYTDMMQYHKFSCDKVRNNTLNTSEVYLNFPLETSEVCDFSCVGLSGTITHKLQIIHKENNRSEFFQSDTCNKPDETTSTDGLTSTIVIIIAIVLSLFVIINLILVIVTLSWWRKKKGEKDLKLFQAVNPDSNVETSQHSPRPRAYEEIDNFSGNDIVYTNTSDCTSDQSNKGAYSKLHQNQKLNINKNTYDVLLNEGTYSNTERSSFVLPGSTNMNSDSGFYSEVSPTVSQSEIK